MTSTIYKYLSAGVLAVWATVLCFLYFTGRVTSYLHPNFYSFVLFCGVGLFLLAFLVVLAPNTVTVGCATPSYSSLGGIIGGAILIVPLVVALTFSKDAFGMTTVENRTYVEDASQLPGVPTISTQQVAAIDPPLPGDSTSQPGESAAPEIPKNNKGDIIAEVVDLLYAAQDPEMRKIFENQPVEVLGQLVPAKINNPKGDRYDVVRLFITCCAADARPVAITLHPKSTPALREMSWVKVRATATFPLVGGESRPLLENAEIIPTEPPEDAFIY